MWILTVYLFGLLPAFIASLWFIKNVMKDSERSLACIPACLFMISWPIALPILLIGFGLYKLTNKVWDIL